jgi:hypothetical protein
MHDEELAKRLGRTSRWGGRCGFMSGTRTAHQMQRRQGRRCRLRQGRHQAHVSVHLDASLAIGERDAPTSQDKGAARRLCLFRMRREAACRGYLIATRRTDRHASWRAVAPSPAPIIRP